MALVTPYKRAVRDYKNSKDAQAAALNYNKTTASLTHTYNEILDTISGLNDSSHTQVQDPRKVVDARLNNYTTAIKREQVDDLKQQLVDTEALERAVYEDARASDELDYRQKLLIDKKYDSKTQLKSEIDTKTKLVFLNEQAFNHKNVVAGIMQTTLFFLVLVCILFYASYGNIISTGSLNWMLVITVIFYIITVVRKWFAVQLYTFEFNILSWIFPSRVQKQCSARGISL